MKRLIYFFLLGSFCIGCQPQPPTYDQMVNDSLSSGMRADTLFLGLSLGMSRGDFYQQCWELNRQGLARQGTQNMTVEYPIKEELKEPATMNFYPEFHEEKIHHLPAWIAYNNWAPWNKNLSADSLVLDVKQMFEKWYGGESFLPAKDENGNQFFIKVDGNREIRLTKSISDREVRADFRDLNITASQEKNKIQLISH